MTAVVFAGGGTGGHVFPMMAVARAMVSLCPTVRPVFVGTARGMEARLVPEQGYPLELLDVLPIRGGGAHGAVRGALRAAALLPESRRLLRKYAPRGVFSVGGYAAGPVSLAAKTLGVPVGLLEPNSVIGLANQLLAPFVQRAYTAFEVADQAFSPAVVRRLGVPIRDGFVPRGYELRPPRFRVLVLGGSQGAQSLNERLPRALRALFHHFPGLQVVHQCGSAHEKSVTEVYGRLGGNFATVVSFIRDMPAAIGAADLVVARSGASAVSEITAIGRPSLLIPYPYASGDHQRINAEALSKQGAAVCVCNSEATEERLEGELFKLLSAPERLRRMARAAAALGRPDAAEQIAADFLKLIELWPYQQRELNGGGSGEVPGAAQPPLKAAPLSPVLFRKAALTYTAEEC